MEAIQNRRTWHLYIHNILHCRLLYMDCLAFHALFGKFGRDSRIGAPRPGRRRRRRDWLFPGVAKRERPWTQGHHRRNGKTISQAKCSDDALDADVATTPSSSRIVPNRSRRRRFGTMPLLCHVYICGNPRPMRCSDNALVVAHCAEPKPQAQVWHDAIIMPRLYMRR